MNIGKITLIVVFALAIGFSAGWYWGYTRPLVRYSRDIRILSGMSDQEMAGALRNSKAAFKSLGSQHHSVALMSLVAFAQIERGSPENAKRFLAGEIASYYNVFYKMDEPSPERDALLAKIDDAQNHWPVLKEAIAKKPGG